MSLAPCLTNINNSSGPLFALEGQGGGGGGGTNLVASTLSVSTITGNPEFLGNAVYMGQPNSTGGADGLTFVTNPPASFGAPLVSTVGARYDMGGQVGYILQNATAGLGSGAGMNILANGITLGSAQGVEIAGGSGAGAGSLTVSSINCSSINGATPGGGGGPTSFNVSLSTTTTYDPSLGVFPIGSFSTTVGHLYNCFLQIDAVSTFTTPLADDRITIIDGVADEAYCELLPWWCSTMVHQPRGQGVQFSFQASGVTSEIYVYSNGAAPSTTFTLGRLGVMNVTDFGTPGAAP